MKVFCFFVVVLLVDRGVSDFRSHPNWPKNAERECGESSSDRITGGTTASIGQFPWMALLKYYLPVHGYYAHLCAGSLISKIHVVTAAHCWFVGEKSPKLQSVILGEFDTSKSVDCDGNFCAAPTQEFRVKRIDKFNYEHFTLTNDIAVLTLESPVEFDRWISPICLPTGLEIFGPTVEVAGWGSTSSVHYKVSQVLKYFKTSIVDPSHCREAIVTNKYDVRKQICAGGTTGDDSCRGDSGGPLMGIPSINDGYGPRYYLLGIVSYGHSHCGIMPAVYTNVTAYMPSILKAMKTN